MLNRLPALLIGLIMACFSAKAANVIFSPVYLTNWPASTLSVRVTPTNPPGVSGNNIVLGDWEMFTTDTNGTLTISNMAPLSYVIEAFGKRKITPIRITVPDTNATLNAKDILSVGLASSSATSAYSIASADSLFVKKWTSIIPSGAVYAFDPAQGINDYQIPTIPGQLYLAVITNTNNEVANPGFTAIADAPGGYFIAASDGMYAYDGIGALMGQPVQEQVYSVSPLNLSVTDVGAAGSVFANGSVISPSFVGGLFTGGTFSGTFSNINQQVASPADPNQVGGAILPRMLYSNLTAKVMFMGDSMSAANGFNSTAQYLVSWLRAQFGYAGTAGLVLDASYNNSFFNRPEIPSIFKASWLISTSIRASDGANSARATQINAGVPVANKVGIWWETWTNGGTISYTLTNSFTTNTGTLNGLGFGTGTNIGIAYTNFAIPAGSNATIYFTSTTGTNIIVAGEFANTNGGIEDFVFAAGGRPINDPIISIGTNATAQLLKTISPDLFIWHSKNNGSETANAVSNDFYIYISALKAGNTNVTSAFVLSPGTSTAEKSVGDAITNFMAFAESTTNLNGTFAARLSYSFPDNPFSINNGLGGNPHPTSAGGVLWANEIAKELGLNLSPAGFGGITNSFQSVAPSNSVSGFWQHVLTGVPFQENGAGLTNIPNAALSGQAWNYHTNAGFNAYTNVAYQSGTNNFSGIQTATNNANAFTGASFTGPAFGAAGAVGANIAGTNTMISGGASTGTGAGGAVVIQTTPSGASGSSVNSQMTRYYVAPHFVTVRTNNTAETIVNITIGTGKWVSGRIFFTSYADNGTDFQATCQNCIFSAVNKAGTVTANSASVVGTVTGASTGTLANTVSATANGASVDIKIAANSSLTPSTEYVVWQMEMDGNDSASVITAK